MRTQARYEQGDERLGNAAWVKDGPVYLHLERISAEFEFGSIYLYRFNDKNELASIAKAENSGIDDNDNWILESLRETRFSNDGVQVIESSVAVESFEVNSELLGSSLAKPLSLSARGLLVYIDYLKRNSLDASQYESELWNRAARTLAIVIMPILSLAFVFGSLRSGGAGSRLAIGVIIGLAYYLASETLANSGQVFNLNPIIISWVPSLALLLVTLVALARIR
jgi:lipopolysaccharide export system permease protein